MLRVYAPSIGRPIDVAPGPQAALPEDATWIDLLRPTPEEETLVERSLGIELPTHEEMQEIEPSSRLYQENGALFLTASVVSGADGAHPESTPVTFILTGQRLVTIRYAEPRSFATFAAHAARQPGLCASGPVALVGLLEAVVDRTADILERVGADLDALSKGVFGAAAGPMPAQAASRDFEKVLKRIARDQDLTAKARDSLVSLGRLLGFLALPGEVKQAKDLRARTKTLARDVASLTDHTAFISNNINFLMDASMGMINIEQNAIIKIFSVAAVVFLPPTLVASIYGMNFDVMPELDWRFGYPFALLLMVLSAILPYLWFKRRGWL
jgi:magnesium transporter